MLRPPLSTRIVELHRQQRMSEVTHWRLTRQAELPPAPRGVELPLLARIVDSVRHRLGGLTRRGLQVPTRARQRRAPAVTLLVPHRLNW